MLKFKIIRMKQLTFQVEQIPNEGYIACNMDASLYAQADTLEDLKNAAIKAVNNHYQDNKKRFILLRIITEEVIAA